MIHESISILEVVVMSTGTVRMITERMSFLMVDVVGTDTLRHEDDCRDYECSQC